MDEWGEIKVVSKLMYKCDKYDNIRSDFRRSEKKPWEIKHFQEIHRGHLNPKTKNEVKFKSQFEIKQEIFKNNQSKNDQTFERIHCYFIFSLVT